MLCESVPEVLGKEIFKFRQCNLTISLLYPLKKRGPSFKQTLISFMCQVGWNWISDSGIEDEIVKSLQTGGRTRGRQAIRKGHQRFQLRCASNEIIFCHLFDKNVSHKSWLKICFIELSFLSNITPTLFIVSSMDSYNLSCETLYQSSAANPESVYSRKRRYCVAIRHKSRGVGWPYVPLYIPFSSQYLCNDISAGLRTVHL